MMKIDMEGYNNSTIIRGREFESHTGHGYFSAFTGRVDLLHSLYQWYGIDAMH